MTVVEMQEFDTQSKQLNTIAWKQPASAKRFVSAAQKLHSAIALHRRGKLREAERLYRAVLEVNRSDFDCLHNLGLLRAQEGKFDDAVGLLRAGARQDPRSVEVHNNLANVLAVLKRHDEAVAGFRMAIALKPDFAEAHNNLGNALAAQGRGEEAVQHYRQAVALRPDYGEAHLNLGKILSERGELDAAATHYQQALTLGAHLAETYCRLGDLQRRKGQVAAAAASYRRALELAPDFTEAHCGLGGLHFQEREFAAAAACFERALAVDNERAEAWLGLGQVYHQAGRYEHALAAFQRVPDLAEAWLGRARALRRLKRPGEAVFACRQAMGKGADAEVVRYYLAALGAEPMPRAAPKRLVNGIFDRYSDRYDRHVTETLKYQTPTLLFDAVVTRLQAGDLDIVDLGCGTGLSGAPFRALARNLIGVDVSANMLEQARQRQIYDELICSELSDFVRMQTKRLDLVLAADVFVYLGDLSDVFDAVHRALKPGGLFAFSVEAAETNDFVLQPTLRYAHSASYLRGLAKVHAFSFDTLETKVLRREEESDVFGHISVLRRR